MRLCIFCAPVALLSLIPVAYSQQAPIIQPGAPGQNSKILTPEAARLTPRTPSAADISFM